MSEQAKIAVELITLWSITRTRRYDALIPGQGRTAMLETYLSQLDLCYFEVTEAFGGIADNHVWIRPDPRLLSVGELAAHVAYWEALRFASGNPGSEGARDLSDCRIKSPLLDPRADYYTNTVETAPSEAQLALTGAEVLAELQRIHQEAMEYVKAANLDLDAPAPHWGGSYRELFKYMAFHIAYHTGQMYSVRHLLGETTPDN